RKEVRQGQIGATWEGTFGSTALEVATWGIRRELFNPIPGRVVDLKRNAGGVRGTIGGGFGMSNGSFQWRAGGEAEIQDDDRKNFDNDGGDPGALILDQDERVRALAFFGQARLDSGDAISILAGFRFDNVGFSVSDRFIAAGDPDDSGSRTMPSFNPSIGVVFKPVDRVELFGSLSRAFETPTTTELANSRAGSGGFNPFLEPQVSLTLEAGFRGRNSLGSVEASIFSTELTNGLVPFEVETDPGRTYYRNAGRSSYMGWEVSLDGRVTPDASVRIAYTRINAEYVLFRTDDARFDGNRIPGLAPRRIDGVVNYTPGLGFVELRGLWQDRVPVDDANLARASPYFLMDLTVGADAVRFGNVGVSPFIGISNLTDYEYTASVVPNAFGSRYFEPGPGRTYRVGLGVTWGG
ncbi:MAG: TonB-dependent receptor, partial [Gemmatimonadota bacterium]|nr:TonB-dependent receptor [Gemmatimonadota bacterium]